MKRRHFLSFAGGLLVTPLSARAQRLPPGPRKTIGALSLVTFTPEQIARSPLWPPLRELGWVEGQNLFFERRFADLKSDRLAGLARELVKRPVDALLVWGPEAALAAARATQSIPIVFMWVTWPVEQGLIESFARPGHNLTGISSYAGVEVSNKRIELTREILPQAKRLAWLWPRDWSQRPDGSRFPIEQETYAAAKNLGFELRMYLVRSSEDVERALADLVTWGADAFLAGDSYSYARMRHVADFAIQHRLPLSCPSWQGPEGGALFSYGNSKAEFPQEMSRLARTLDRVLRGEDPATIPVERPNRYELVVNLRTAKALGLTLPNAFLLRADRVIE